MKHFRLQRAICATLIVTTCWLVLPGFALQKGSTGGGTIYYDNNGTMYTMNSDGNNKTAMPAGVRGGPSRNLHGGSRWFLVRDIIPFETYPNGSPRRECFVIRGDGLVTVQLTTQPDLEIGNVSWSPGDGFSCIARRWLGGVVVEGGIYTASLATDGSGNITGLASQPNTPLISNALITDESGYLRPNMNIFDWSPDGQRVVYNNSTTQELWTADLTNVHSHIYTGSWANTPAWSPANSKIAFMSGNGGISTINPDGTGSTVIIKRNTFYSFGNPTWSPTGSHLVYVGFKGSGGPQYDVFRSTSTGGQKSNLTNTGSPMSEFPVGWR